MACLVVMAVLLAPDLEFAEDWKALIHIQVDKTRIGMGRAVAVRALVTSLGGFSPAGTRLLPYVNGKRWGAPELADEHGQATFYLPLPNPGAADIHVEARPPHRVAREEWIWGDRAEENQVVYLQGQFRLPEAPRSAALWAAADDAVEIFLNGRRVGSASGWARAEPFREAAAQLVGGKTSSPSRRGTQAGRPEFSSTSSGRLASGGGYSTPIRPSAPFGKSRRAGPAPPREARRRDRSAPPSSGRGRPPWRTGRPCATAPS
ncbi:MAG: hypothetical protein HY717_13255 [Planctomycetes bacterium]|nr:hypothetical protein [Planctomycetota bacterium]